MSGDFIERQIAIGLIVSTQLHQDISGIFKPQLLQSQAAITITTWCQNHHLKHNKAPGRDIQLIFDKHCRRGKLDKDQQEDIEDILLDLSEQEQENEIDIAVLAEEAKKYLAERALLQFADEIRLDAERGDSQAAHAKIGAFLPPDTEQPIDPDFFADDPERTRKIFEDTPEPVIEYPGKLGELLNEHMVKGGFVAFLGQEKIGKCLVADTLIVLPDGSSKRIEDVVRDKDPKILALDESIMKFVEYPICDYWDNGMKSCLTIRTKTGREITTTENHPYLTPDGWKPVSELKPNDRIAVARSIPFFGTKKICDAKIKVLAYLLAEGGFNNDNCPVFTSTYLEIQDDFASCVEEIGDSISYGNCDNKTLYVVNNKSQKKKHFVNTIAAWIDELGLKNKKSASKFIPNEILRLNKNNLSLFLNILFSCDGSIFKAGIEYCSASERMARQVFHLLLRFGIVSKIRSKLVNKKYYWTISILDKENILLFLDTIGFSFHKKEKSLLIIKKLKDQKRSNCFLDTAPIQIIKKINDEIDAIKLKRNLRENIAYCLKNNKNMSKSIVAEIAKNTNSKTAKEFADGDIIWDYIEEITGAGQKKTFDLSVAKHHNFIANDFVAHNTWTLMDIGFQGKKNGRKVAYFAAGDMNRDEMEMRKYIYLARKSERAKYCGDILVPVLDCWKNQTGSCKLSPGLSPFSDRTEKFKTWDRKLKFSELIQNTFREFPDHVVCRKCVGKGRFDGSVWLKVRPACEPLTWKEGYQTERDYVKRMRGSAFYFDEYPADTLSPRMIEIRLETWKRAGFGPDVILIDYPDIMDCNEDDRRMDFRHRKNSIWKKLRALAHKFNCLVVAVTQADAEAYKRDWLELDNFSEDKRQYAHATAFFGLNQNEEESKVGLFRINQLIVRSGKRGNNFATVLQRLEIGRPHLGSF